MADLVTLKARLAEAEEAHHKIMTTGGTARLRHDTNGAMKWIEYHEPDIAKLESYINRLRAEIAALEGTGYRRAPGRRIAI